ncbi:MAG: hypothetical protein WD824_23675 [Cyclobacteriaceae bacterium]
MKSKKNRTSDQTQDDRERNDALNKADNNERDGKLPGEYPPQEDIMNRLNTQRVGMDVENFSSAIGIENLNINQPVITDPESIEEDPLFPTKDVEDRLDNVSMQHPIPKDIDKELDIDSQERNESDVTEEDLQALGPKDLSMDMGDDEQLLKNRVWPVDMAGKDLDIPGAELDDENEAIGSEDEENNSYSLGGDAHEDNLEGK